ncbi:MAG: glycosyltransferase [Rhodocyclaceae bacterium]|nr:glycosyltransferase [Rhodocyclaceae bacterium]
MTPIVSVIICSHNPRDQYLRRVLAALAGQTLPLTQWELILVDNASAQPLAPQWGLSWHPGARHLVEPRLGLTHARLAGIRAAHGPLLVFLDDDNVADPAYLETAVRIAQNQPAVGVFGAGRIDPEFEEIPKPELAPYFSYLALRTLPASLIKLDPAQGNVPWGAGLCVRAEIANAYTCKAENCSIRAALGRTGTRLLAGEDDEFSWVAHELGLDHGIFTELRLTHLIDKRRTQLSYFEAAMRGSGYSAAWLAMLHHRTDRNPYAIPSLSKAHGFAKRLHLLAALMEVRRYLRFQQRSALDRVLAHALADGWDEGMADFAAKVGEALGQEHSP